MGNSTATTLPGGKVAGAVTAEPAAANPYDSRFRIAFADAFRAFAILSVVIAHVIDRIDPKRSYALAHALGILGVDCFFMLSGYLLSRQYVEAILNRRPFPSWKLYAARRFYRIWPLYAVAVLVSALSQSIHTHRINLADVLAHLTMTHSFVAAYLASGFNVPLWTMAVDTDFYILLPIVAAAFFSANVASVCEDPLHCLLPRSSATLY